MTTGNYSHVDMVWEDPGIALFLRALASFSRLIVFDRRGTGASDPQLADSLPLWESYAQDLTAVLDAVGSQQAALVAQLDASPMALFFAGTRPECTRALVLVLHRRGYQFIPVANGRYLAEHIPDARLVEMAGTEQSLFWETPALVLEHVERFLTGVRRSVQPTRMLATVLFTDIVSSTERAGELGDRCRRELLKGARPTRPPHGRDPSPGRWTRARMAGGPRHGPPPATK